MKDPASYNKLWQSKMQELPLEGDANTAWQKMAGSLEENMPVSGTVVRPNYISSRLLIRIIAVVAAISIIYLVYHFNIIRTKPVKINNKHTGYTDSVSSQNGSKNDSVNNQIKTVNPVNNNTDKADTSSQKTTVSNTKRGSQSGTAHQVNPVAAGYSRPLASVHKGNLSNRTHFNKKVSNKANINNSSPRNSVPEQASATDVSGPVAVDQKNKSAVDASANTADHSLINTTDSSVITKQNAADKPAKAKDTTIAKNNPAAKPSADSIKKKPARSKSALSNKAKKTGGYNRFELELKTGFNTNKNSSVIPMLGIAGAYYITPKFSVGIGANLFSYRLIEGSYSNGNYKYTTIGDSGKVIGHTADKLTVESTAKLYTIDIPVMADYRITQWLSVKAGPIISIPLKKPTITSTLGPFTNPADTLSAYKTILSDANNSTMASKVHMGFTGMLTLSFQRFNINGGYLTDFTPYTINSSLGKTSATYHSFHLGISYLLVQPKKKKKK